MCETIETHDAVDEIEAGYEPVEYLIDLNTSEDPKYGRKVERLPNNSTIEVPEPGSDALLYECQRCGHRHTGSEYDDERTVANTRATCTECNELGGLTHDDHRVVGVKVSDDEAEDDDDEPEIVADGGEDVTEHVDDETIAAAIEKHDDPEHPDALTTEEVRDYLAGIQQSFDGYWDEHMDALEDGALEVVADDGGIIVFADHTGHGWSEVLDAVGIDDEIARSVIMSIHHKAASKHTDYSWSTVEPFVVRKPDHGGQRYVEALVNSLMREGLSPGQAWAVYGVHVAGHSRNAWASMCGYSDHSAISEPLRKAVTKAGHLGLVD